MKPETAEARMLLSVIEHAQNLVAIADYGTGRLCYLNPAGMHLMGLTDEAAVAARWAPEFFTDVGFVQAPDMEAALLEHGRWEGRSEFRHFLTGEPIPVTLSTFVVERSPENRPTMIACIAQDLRTAQEHEQRLHTALEAAAYRAREQHALADLSQLAVDGDLDHLLAAAADAAAALMGVNCTSVARAEEPGGTLRVLAYRGQPPIPDTFAPGADSQPGYAAATDEIIICPDRYGEHRFATEAMNARGLRSGVCVPIGATSVWGVLTAHSARPREYSDREVLFLRSVTAVLAAAIRRIEAEEALRHQSLHDPLTGLPNRALAHQQIDAALAAARESARTVAALLIDLDEFKSLNDRLGHAVGDDALIRLAEQLQSVIHPTDTVARIGGDEFLIVCPDTASVEEAITLATRITELQIGADSAGHELRFTASVGVAVAGPEETRETLIRRADAAMYHAKATGSGYALAP
ncbi:diguanylate cyclase [Rhodococcus sp. IEGM 248]|uniref:diguanylate cyclase domain-containing protein n=1 Tax=Rhodococcus opacus TaxID=37919 RepID=UPI0013C1A680|nr:diguanylate cyclase [Rhodococcus opacus]MDV7088315.1 sensor domain-containing diguanylate cyclase [Rhodococcus opacus]NDV10288.1 diguanylate cyclase [Rhodococcus sp. IEGM 248]